MPDSPNIKIGDNKSKVAYEMATYIFNMMNKRVDEQTKNEFLDLVQECVMALTPGGR